MFSRALKRSKKATSCPSEKHAGDNASPGGPLLGLIAGNGPFPLEFVRAANAAGRPVLAVCHKDETDPNIASLVSHVEWIKVGELGRLVDTFASAGVTEVAMAGGINRVRLFGGVKLDARGIKLLAKIKSTKDDLIMRGIADELQSEGIQVIECTRYLSESLAPEGLLTKTKLTEEENTDISVGIEAIKAMSSQHIGQVVVVREGVIVAVEAVEGTDATIRRGGELGGAKCVVVKCAKLTQDMRFDVPTVGIRTIETMTAVKARVLALEAGRTLIMNKEETVKKAEKAGISVVGCPSLV